MAEASEFLAKKRYAVVTGGNKGIGLEICRQLALKGVFVILTARDETRGIEAVKNLKELSAVNSDNLKFHQLDVTNSTTVSSLAEFIRAKFGKLDILVNNAGITGCTVNWHALKEAGFDTPGTQVNYDEIMTQTYDMAEDCLKTNYYGVKKTIEALLPLLQLSDSPRIVNVSSSMGKLKNIPNEEVRRVLDNADQNLTEERLDELLNNFMRDLRDGSFVEKGWPPHSAAYIVSKAALNAYTRLLSRKYSSIVINCVCPGFVKTDINEYNGYLSVEEGAACPVRLALMPQGSPSGLFYVKNEVSSYV